MKVFLGGTCNESTWRDELIPCLEATNIDYFNPVVEDWNKEAQAEEIRQKEEECDVHLYVITNEMTGVFSIAEAVASANMTGKFCVFVYHEQGFDKGQIKSLQATAKLIESQPYGLSFYFDEEDVDWAKFMANVFANQGYRGVEIKGVKPTLAMKALENIDYGEEWHFKYTFADGSKLSFRGDELKSKTVPEMHSTCKSQ